MSREIRPTPAQLRAARGLLGWSQADLAEASGVSLRTVKVLESAPDLDPVPGRAGTVAALVDALHAAGVGFIAGTGRIGVERRLRQAP
ncbi:helix-turn-helix domain-containing protein [Roseomonas sp. SSH11]|uniref:Helix-turn-helix domain-containing protein n=1 Tax=Pararoseomonas baculiformis TaxID=2820812 RepID=A0ABS4AL30_9PROT|nr:helix-turn-helix domain-containing protein [Pararoseomonas baculiformis]MBP0447735.1 helix-turn-helix domain-containing protein [Pararoseomonas baculiformis]